MEGLPRGREGEKRREEREEEQKAAGPGQETLWGSQPESAWRLSLLISYMVLRNSMSLLMFVCLFLESSSTIPAGNSDIQKPNWAPIVKDKEAELSR